jgi:hypothetical protein
MRSETSGYSWQHREEYTKVGSIPVDSGQIMLVDPCYIKQDFESEYDAVPGLNYAGACKQTLGKGGCGGFGNEHCSTIAFATRTAYGDGNYPVYVKRAKDGRILSVRIDFEEPEDEIEDDDDDDC